MSSASVTFARDPTFSATTSGRWSVLTASSRVLPLSDDLDRTALMPLKWAGNIDYCHIDKSHNLGAPPANGLAVAKTPVGRATVTAILET